MSYSNYRKIFRIMGIQNSLQKLCSVKSLKFSVYSYLEYDQSNENFIKDNKVTLTSLLYQAVVTVSGSLVSGPTPLLLVLFGDILMGGTSGANVKPAT